MFLKDDEITVLLQHPDQENLFLGVVGHFSGSDVHFHAKLKVPIKAKRASTSSGKSPTPSSDIHSPIG
ncbi:hypothetical protein BYT27DRAFT_6753759 [Phlegmacium glaucopus]|nr:hypothetical protein BYT27DRAFT_6753759 [Phlegmacium glaucopus]